MDINNLKMNINFYKYHGAGNDFIIIDAANLKNKLTSMQISDMCTRRTGIGADGVLILEKIDNNPSYSLIMKYYNSDGTLADMCGNGLRCAAAFANQILKTGKQLKIKTDAGVLATEIIDNTSVKIEIPIIQHPAKTIINGNIVYFCNTGVPHAVIIKNEISNINVNEEGSFYRKHVFFQPDGTNVNFISQIDRYTYSIRTYERGVEEETLACGTGISASALVLNYSLNIPFPIIFKTKNQDTLKVESSCKDNSLSLTGPVKQTFRGCYSLEVTQNLT